MSWFLNILTEHHKYKNVYDYYGTGKLENNQITLIDNIKSNDILLIYTSDSSGRYCCSEQFILNTHQKPFINGFSVTDTFKLKLIAPNKLEIIKLNDRVAFIYKNN